MVRQQPESAKTVAAFEVPPPSEADRNQFLAVLRAAAAPERMHFDAESGENLKADAKIGVNFEMTMKTAVWRGSDDDEALPFAMDQFDHLGRIWIMFSPYEILVAELTHQDFRLQQSGFQASFLVA